MPACRSGWSGADRKGLLGQQSSPTGILELRPVARLGPAGALLTCECQSPASLILSIPCVTESMTFKGFAWRHEKF